MDQKEADNLCVILCFRKDVPVAEDDHGLDTHLLVCVRLVLKPTCTQAACLRQQCFCIHCFADMRWLELVVGPGMSQQNRPVLSMLTSRPSGRPALAWCPVITPVHPVVQNTADQQPASTSKSMRMHQRMLCCLIYCCHPK
jgi:hypothetical protein